jgi:acyl-coenzyme A synthetase/AMP-(fatty) acid ligase
VADTIPELLARRAELTPEALFFVDERCRTVTFGHLRDDVARTAARLTETGFQRDDVVSWQLPNRLATILLMLALRQLGAVQNPLVTILREHELGFICRQASSAHLMVPSRFGAIDYVGAAHRIAEQLPRLQVHVVDGDLPAGDPATLDADPATGSDCRWLFYTSGTTSDPKGVRHTDRTLIAAATNYCASLRVTPQDQAAAPLPLAHVGGLVHIVVALLSGSSVVTSAVFDDAAIDLFASQRVTLLGSGVRFVRAHLARQRTQPAASTCCALGQQVPEVI